MIGEPALRELEVENVFFANLGQNRRLKPSSLNHHNIGLAAMLELGLNVLICLFSEYLIMCDKFQICGVAEKPV